MSRKQPLTEGSRKTNMKTQKEGVERPGLPPAPPKKIIAKRTRKPKANSSVNNVVESEGGNVSAVINMTNEEYLQNENYNLSGKVTDLSKELYQLSWELRSSNNLFHEANNELFRLKNKSLWQRIKDVFCYE